MIGGGKSRGEALPLRFKGAYFPKDIILMGVRSSCSSRGLCPHRVPCVPQASVDGQRCVMSGHPRLLEPQTHTRTPAMSAPMTMTP